jgi:hypothetical protein
MEFSSHSGDRLSSPSKLLRISGVAGRGSAKCLMCSTLVDRRASPDVVARIAAVVASDFRFAYFGTAAFAERLLRLDQKLMVGIPMNPRAGWLTPSTPRPNCCGDSVAISSRPATRRWCCTPMAGWDFRRDVQTGSWAAACTCASWI